MKTNYVLIDYENAQVKSLALLKDERFRVWVFLGPKNTKLPVEFVLAMQELGKRAGYIIVETAGPNALDFHIAYYLGVLATDDPAGFFHIISRDTGFVGSHALAVGCNTSILRLSMWDSTPQDLFLPQFDEWHLRLITKIPYEARQRGLTLRFYNFQEKDLGFYAG